MNNLAEQGTVQKQLREHSSCPDLRHMTLLLFAQYNWHKIK